MVIIVQRMLPGYRDGLWEMLYDLVGDYSLVCAKGSRVPTLAGNITIRAGHPALELLSQVRPASEVPVVIMEGKLSLPEFWLSVLLKKLGWIKLVLWTAEWEKHKNPTLIWIKNQLRRYVYRRADKVMVYSGKAYRKILANGVSGDRVVNIYNGIRLPGGWREQVPPQQVREFIERQRSEGRCLAVFCGQLIYEKNLDLLAEALRHPATKELAFLIIGDGKYRKSLEAQIPVERHVMFAGHLALDQAASAIRLCDFGFLPGIGGLAINHYLLAGIPVLVSETDGTEDDLVVDGVNGLRFETGNLESFVTALLRLSDNSLRRPMLGQVETWMVDKGIERTAKLIASIVKSVS